jgi:hypothetical protein
MVKIVKGLETDKWLPKDWRKCTFPILSEPAKTLNDIIGTAFLLRYEKVPYIVTANHVIENGNPVMAFSKKDKQLVSVSSSQLQQAGLHWIKHPAGLDLAAIPFLLPPSILSELDLLKITEDYWALQPNIKVGDEVAHLGYPEKGTSKYTNRSPCPYPQAMPGKITGFRQTNILMETASAHGASGGPVFLRRENKSPCLVGVVIEARMKGNHTRTAKAEYLNVTTALVASLIKDIMETEEMKKQIDEFIGKIFALRE